MARIRSIKPDFWTDIQSSEIDTPCFIYVISEDEGKDIAPCKIGIATNLKKRFSSLQGGNHRELYMHTTIFVCNRRDALEAEHYCLSSSRSKRLMSEWINSSPIQITKLLIEFLNCESIRFIKSEESNG